MKLGGAQTVHVCAKTLLAVVQLPMKAHCAHTNKFGFGPSVLQECGTYLERLKNRSILPIEARHNFKWAGLQSWPTALVPMMDVSGEGAEKCSLCTWCCHTSLHWSEQLQQLEQHLQSLPTSSFQRSISSSRLRAAVVTGRTSQPTRRRRSARIALRSWSKAARRWSNSAKRLCAALWAIGVSGRGVASGAPGCASAKPCCCNFCMCRMKAGYSVRLRKLSRSSPRSPTASRKSSSKLF
mmetsp:Transcript_89620/g.231299  ORF Transcript_89620/g.231299 Transcript_89620/m.231299 type:complete len:239 (+) Transcript_89620:334-1050(+)